MKKIISLCRIFLASVFVFSGFVKAVDPLGTAYKIEDYLLVYQMEWALPVSLILSFGLIALELSLGVFLLMNILPKTTKWSLVVLMSFFTLLTLYDAIYNPVPDCGCFGDALILTNWQTFYKNIIIDLLIVALFLYPVRIINKKKHLISALAIFIVSLSFSYYNLRHLPIIDFRFWKNGTQVYEPESKAVEYYVSYKNKNTGEIKEFLSPNFPYNDSVWLSQWDFIKLREVNPNLNTKSIAIFDEARTNVTGQILGYSGHYFLIIAYNLDKINAKNAYKIEKIIQSANQEAIPIYILTASLDNTIDQFRANYQIDIPVFLADDIDLKTIIRSNPGLILLNNGKVIKKWSSADFPKQISKFKD